jgi:two-component system, cell cycle sensor histidine kinase and response regulator CckA
MPSFNMKRLVTDGDIIPGRGFMRKTQFYTMMHQNFERGRRVAPPMAVFVWMIILANAVWATGGDAGTPLIVKVGAYANSPKIFMDESGKVAGFWPDLLEHIAEAENWEIEYVWGTWSEGLERLKTKQIEIMPDVAFTEKRNKLYVFSESPVLTSWTRVYANRENMGIESVLDLGGKRVAALKGSVNLEGPGGLREITEGFNLNCTFLELGSYVEVFKAVEENRADTGITNRNFGDKHAKNFNVFITPIIFQPISMKFAFPKDVERTPYLAGKIDDHITMLKHDGDSVYYRLLRAYFEAEIAERKVEVFPGWLNDLLKATAVLFVFFTLVIITSRVQVRRKIKEIKIKNEALRESEKRYRNLAEGSFEGIVIHDKGLILEANDQFYKMFGYEPPELAGINAIALTATTASAELIREQIASGSLGPYETTGRRKDGSTFPKARR